MMRSLLVRISSGPKNIPGMKMTILHGMTLGEQNRRSPGIIGRSRHQRESLRDILVSSIVKPLKKSAAKWFLSKRKITTCSTVRIDRIVTSPDMGDPDNAGAARTRFLDHHQGSELPLGTAGRRPVPGRGYLSDLIMRAGLRPGSMTCLYSASYGPRGKVVSVMLPHGDFLPVFTLLEDQAIFPGRFQPRQLLQEGMRTREAGADDVHGFGCNAAGVIACRIIDSPRELIATVTNNFVPCNRRFPTLIALSAIFIAGGRKVQIPGCHGIGTGRDRPRRSDHPLVISKILSKTILKGLPSSFALELPPTETTTRKDPCPVAAGQDAVRAGPCESWWRRRPGW